MSVAISTPASNDFNTSIGLPDRTTAQSRPLRHGSAPIWKEWRAARRRAKPSKTAGSPSAEGAAGGAGFVPFLAPARQAPDGCISQRLKGLKALWILHVTCARANA
jgi:hypothetical protein